MNTSPPVPRRSTLGEGELTLSGVLKLSDVAEAGHVPLIEALQLSMKVIRLVAETHDKGEVVGVLDAAHLVCSTTGNLAIGGRGGNPIAPELKRGEMPDRLTDVYALGALMYRLLTGRRAETARIIEPPSHFNPAVDSELDELVLSALDEDPSERPYSARELERRLLSVFEELGLEDSHTEANQLIAKAKPKPKPAPKSAPRRAVEPEATIDYGDDDDDEFEPQLERNPLEKKWLIGGGAVLALLLIALIAWPSSSSKREVARYADDVAPAKVVKAPVIQQPSVSPVQAKLVEPEAVQMKPAKKAESPKKSTRRARR
ncbi:MAG: hypothetical protein JNK82_40660 [Myxococcaceae bacterium]|nr:hypothetical protein [Myxococcaceae bacterium]